MSYEKMRIKTEAGKCFLCGDAPCTKMCTAGFAVSDLIRSIRFENPMGAAEKLRGTADACASCAAPCMQACSRAIVAEPIQIPQLIAYARSLSGSLNEQKETDLSVDFCGVHCENPFFLSSSIVGSNAQMVEKAFSLGWAGAALKTIGMFVPEETSPRFSRLSKEENPFIGFKNIEQISDHPLEENLGFIRELKKAYPEKIIIASIMGRTKEEWTALAEMTEEAGADMVECNFSCPQMAEEGLGSDVGIDPLLVESYTSAVREGTSLPILAKMTPNVTDMCVPARAAVRGGADSIAAINTIKSVMNIDLDSFASSPSVSGKSSVGGYSGKAVKPIALRFIYDMASDPQLAGVPISGMGGIETWRDAAEFLTLGCETVQITTAVMQYGYRIIDDLLDGLRRYLSDRGFRSVTEMIGRAVPNLLPTDQLDRASIQYPKFRLSECVGCGRCYISCFDGGHQAITMDPVQRRPKLDTKKCVGCHLCRLVCPVNAISAGPRVVTSKKVTGSVPISA